MKIGVMTYWTSKDNYGQQLQCYALQTYLKQLGHEAYLIRYDKTNDAYKPSLIDKVIEKAPHFYKAFNPAFWSLRKIRKAQDAENERQYQLELKEHPRRFEEFQKKFLSVSDKVYTSWQELRENPPEADIYMVGSDQVWHYPEATFKNAEAEIRAYMLDFGKDDTKRISAAASWGRTEISENWKKNLKPLFNHFDMVTVREKSGIELCRQCGKDAVLVADPTLYLEAEDYQRIYRDFDIRKPKKPYILVYWVNNGGNPPMEELMKFAGDRGVAVEYVTGNCMVDKYPKNYATIPEWLYLIDHAEYVATNSFHCCVFSLLFHKRFGAIKIQGEQEGMNSRIDTLFENCGVSARYIGADDLSGLEMEAEEIKMSDGLKLKEAVSGKIEL